MLASVGNNLWPAYREKILADDVTTDDFLIGGWVSFYPFEIDSYEYQLDQMAAAGINFNIFPRDFGEGKMYDAEYWNEVEQQYAKRNMVYLMNGNMDKDLVAVGVEYAAGKEHCIGYHVKDEPGGTGMRSVAMQMKAYRDADPQRYPFTNLLPSYAGEGWLGGTYSQYVKKYVRTVGAENMEYLSHDFYPFGADGTNNMLIFSDLEVIRSVAYENGKMKTHAFPQSTGWRSSRMPNADEMRWNVYAYLAYGFKALSWFNIVCPGSSDNEGEGFYESIIYRDGTIHNKELYDAWSELNWEVRGLSSALMQLDTVHAYHVNKDVQNVEYLPEDHFLQPVGENDFVVSIMETKDGKQEYVMLFNKSLSADASCEFAIDPQSGITGVEYFDPNIGEHIALDISDGKLKDDFKVGEGRLYRLIYGDSATSAPTNRSTSEPTNDPAVNGDNEPKENYGAVICGIAVAVAAAVAVGVALKSGYSKGRRKTDKAMIKKAE